MVYVDTEAVGLDLFHALERLRALRVGATHSAGKVRLVTHLDVDDEGVGVALDAWRSIAADVAREL
jgi:threonine aldolase